jgi:hypothetical protein
MLSWRGVADGSASTGSFLILRLLEDGRIVRGASSETVLDQQLMQISEGRYRDPRRTDRHAGAGGGIKYPCRHHDDHAGRHLDVSDLATSAPFYILVPNAAPIECVPAIMDLDLVPDMGRMTERLPLPARTTFSPAPMPAADALLPSTH